MRLPLIPPFHAVLIMVALVYVPHFIKGYLIFQARGQYDNVNPRSQGVGIKGEMGKRIERAGFAHQNSFESFILFSAAVMMASLAKVDIQLMSYLSTIFIAVRAAYIPVYIFGASRFIASIRSLLFFIGLYAILHLMISAASATRKVEKAVN